MCGVILVHIKSRAD
ncbi:mCG1048036 [Mus musculus]|nr:mCG1048036 [Mus musculus]